MLVRVTKGLEKQSPSRQSYASRQTARSVMAAVVGDGINYTNNPVVSEIEFASSMRHGLGRRFQRAHPARILRGREG